MEFDSLIIRSFWCGILFFSAWAHLMFWFLPYVRISNRWFDRKLPSWKLVGNLKDASSVSTEHFNLELIPNDDSKKRKSRKPSMHFPRAQTIFPEHSGRYHSVLYYTTNFLCRLNSQFNYNYQIQTAKMEIETRAVIPTEKRTWTLRSTCIRVYLRRYKIRTNIYITRIHSSLSHIARGNIYYLHCRKQSPGILISRLALSRISIFSFAAALKIYGRNLCSMSLWWYGEHWIQEHVLR